MRTKLTSVGDELAVVLDEDVLARLGYTAETVVDVRVQEGSIVIVPVRDDEPVGGPQPSARSPGT